MMTINQYARTLLKEMGYTVYDIWGYDPDNLIYELKKFYPNGLAWTYVEVANALLTIAKPKLIHRAKYLVTISTDDECIAVDAETEEEAVKILHDTFENWIMEMTSKWIEKVWIDRKQLDENDINEWNDMIETRTVYFAPYDKNTDEYLYETEYERNPPDRYLDSIGWKPITLKEANELIKPYRLDDEA